MAHCLYLDLHVLQSVPPSNLNRDDAGTPKHALFGGARRARVSSQAWKRATRTAWAEGIPEAERAIRTKKVASLLADRLQERESLTAPDAARLATALLTPLGITASQKKDQETAYLLFFGNRQLESIANLVAGRGEELLQLDEKVLADELKSLDIGTELMQTHPAEVALFGRMVADRAELNVDASVQVAHALSTHEVRNEFDYYTAVDDKNAGSETGAGMIGTVEFNSATLYRYATVAVHQLHVNLGGTEAVMEHTAAAAARFAETFTKSKPSGHQNSFAHRTLPHAVIAMLRTDQPVNLVSAFEQPIFNKAGVAEKSARRLAEESLHVAKLWGHPSGTTLACYAPYAEETEKHLAEAFGASINFSDLTSRLQRTTLTWLREGAL